MTAYKLVVFDWDGTLIDSIERILTCFRYTLDEAGIPWPGDTAIKETIGLPLVEAFPTLVPNCDETQTEQFVDIYRRFWLGDKIPESTLFPGVEDMLAWLKQQGYTLAVATGKSRVGLERDWKTFHIDHHFSTSRCAGEGKPKPNPDILQQILRELQFAPQDTLMIGDHVLDLDMAAAADVHSIGVTTGSVGRKRLMHSKPVTCLDVVTELRGFLKP